MCIRDSPWLNLRELTVLTEGGYFDTEGVLHNADGCIRCTSMVKSTGKRCRNFAIPGELTCRCHGGALARAKAGKNRIYSGLIQSPEMANVYERTLNDKEVAGVREELGLLRTLLVKVLQDNPDLGTKELKEVSSVMGEVRQLVTDCNKAEIRLGQLVDIGKVTLIINALAKIVAKYIKDEGTLKKIGEEFSKIPWPATLASTPQPDEEEPVRAVPIESSTIR